MLILNLEIRAYLIVVRSVNSILYDHPSLYNAIINVGNVCLDFRALYILGKCTKLAAITLSLLQLSLVVFRQIQNLVSLHVKLCLCHLLRVSVSCDTTI